MNSLTTSNHPTIPTSLIDSLLSTRNAAIAEAQAAHQHIQTCLSLCREASISGLETGLSGGFITMPILSPDWLAQAIAAIDAGGWDRLMKQSGLFSYMNSTAIANWNNQILNLSTPPLTRENILATFANLLSGKEDLFERGVVAIFRRLSADPVTGLPIQLGQTMSIKGLLDIFKEADVEKADAIDDLNKALHVLDNQPAPNPRKKMTTTLKGASARADFTINTDYFSLLVQPKTRSARISFTRPDLVTQLNNILVKHCPDAQAAPLSLIGH